MPPRVGSSFLLLAFVFPAAISVSLAQSPSANITGLVSDSQSGAIAGATVSARNTATGVTSSAITNSTGFYGLMALPIGQYEVTTELTGFKKYVRRGLVLTTGQSLDLAIRLEVGGVTESVTVSGAATAVETRTSDVSQLVESKSIEDLPIGDRRSLNIVNMTGAAVFVSYDTAGKPNFSLAGGRTQSQNFFIDGGSAQNMRLGVGQVDVDPPIETVSEVKILSNNYSAEYGGSSGGVIIASTKSGTNRVQGSLFEYLRNEKLDAANFFAPVVGIEKVRAPLRYNVFGGTIGGPVMVPRLYKGTDRTFFFYAYEGSRRNEGSTRTFTVPTVAQRGGDFSRSSNPIYDPATTVVREGRNVRQIFPGSIIPASRIDPVGMRLIEFYPLPNRDPDNLSGANNFRSNFGVLLTRNNHTAKVDHNVTDNDKLSFRYLYNSDNRTQTSVFPREAGDTVTDLLRHVNFVYLGYTKVLTPTLLNEARFTYGNRVNWETSKGLGADWATQLGIRGVSDGAFPTVNVAGYQTMGASNQERRQFPIQQYQIIDNLSWVKGRHSAKFGIEYRRSMNYEISRPSLAGVFGFTPLLTGQPGTAASGNGAASMLLGLAQTFSSRETDLLDRNSVYWSAFAQDSWLISRSLTLNLGVRWEVDTPIVDANGHMNGFDMNAINPVSNTPGVVRFAGVNGWPVKPYRTDLNNFAPRFGFAWKPFGDDRTVVRGGYGIFFGHPFDAAVPNSASLGFEKSLSLASPDNGITPAMTLRQGISGGLSFPVRDDSFGAVPVGRPATTAVTFYEAGRSSPYSHQYNLGVQRELRGQVLVEASYLANLSRKLPSPNLSINQIRPEVLGPNNQSQRDRPYPQFNTVSLLLPTLGVSNYHALAVRAEKRFSRGLNFLATYTWSKVLNNTSEGPAQVGADGGPYSDLYNRRLDYGPGGNDVRHRMTWSTVYELPFGRGHRYLSQGPLRYIAGDWSFGLLALLQGGAPVTVEAQVDTRNAFASGALRPDLLGNPNLSADRRTLNQWFDTTAFRQPAAFRNGTAGVGIIRADGKVNFDLSALKSFPWGERRKVQLRGEFFNLFNHPNFGTPGRIFGAPGFGVVSSADPARRAQVGLRVVF